LLVGGVQGKFELLLDVTGLADRGPRGADDDNIGGADSLGNLQGPVLPRQQIFLIQPWLKAIGTEPLVQVSDCGFVGGGVAQEYAQRAGQRLVWRMA
jgi:hypothetical protein